MRASRTPRIPTAAKLAVGASVLAFPATALAVTNTSATPASAAPTAALSAAHARLIGYGDRTTVHGTAPGATVDQPVELEYLAAGSHHWRTIARGRIHAGDRFRLSARLHRSGRLQVRELPAADSAGTAFSSAQLGPAANTGTSASPSSPSVSPVSRVVVRPALQLGKVSDVIAGSSTALRGRLLPAVAGRRIVLEGRDGGRWAPIGAARSGRLGGFDIHFRPTSTEQVRVAFAGDASNARALSTSQTVSPMQYAEVSWYNDAGNTACGFHATYGIASRTLPCGSHVTLSYGGRSVVATVDDRGPFVYSRLYDLNQNTAAALGMSGVATVLASV